MPLLARRHSAISGSLVAVRFTGKVWRTSMLPWRRLAGTATERRTRPRVAARRVRVCVCLQPNRRSRGWEAAPGAAPRCRSSASRGEEVPPPGRAPGPPIIRSRWSRLHLDTEGQRRSSASVQVGSSSWPRKCCPTVVAYRDGDESYPLGPRRAKIGSGVVPDQEMLSGTAAARARLGVDHGSSSIPMPSRCGGAGSGGPYWQ